MKVLHITIKHLVEHKKAEPKNHNVKRQSQVKRQCPTQRATLNVEYEIQNECDSE